MFVSTWARKMYKLLIETARYTGVPRAEGRYRGTRDIEDEYNFVIKCAKDGTLRNTYITTFDAL